MAARNFMISAASSRIACQFASSAFTNGKWPTSITGGSPISDCEPSRRAIPRVSLSPIRITLFRRHFRKRPPIVIAPAVCPALIAPHLRLFSLQNRLGAGLAQRRFASRELELSERRNPGDHVEGVVADVIAPHGIPEGRLLDDPLFHAFAQQPEEELLLAPVGVA